MSTIFETRLAAFNEATKGQTANRIARAMNKLTPGIDWRGCSKSDLAERFADPPSYADRLNQAGGKELRAAIEALGPVQKRQPAIHYTRMQINELDRCADGIILAYDCKHPALVVNNWRRSLRKALQPFKVKRS